jgi:type I restriction enzyme S subunit
MKEYKLTDVCDFQGGTQPPKSEWINEPREGYIRMLQIRDFTQGKSQHIEFVKDNKKVNKCSADDILIARYGASIGKIVTGLEGAYNVALIKTIPDEKLLTKKYLQSILKSPVFQNFILSVGARAAQAGFNKEDLSRFKLALPSLQDQICIAQILTQAENLITQRKESIALLDELLKSTFLEMFGDPVKNEKGWNIKTIEQLVTKNKTSIKRGPFGGALKKEIFVEDGYLVYEQFHALNNDFSMARYFIDEAKFNELKGFEVKPKDIIVSCSGVYLGKLAIVPPNAKKGIINQALLKITLDEKIMRNQFFVFHFTHKNFKEKYFDSNRGAGIPNFPPMSDFKKFNFIDPPIEIQDKFIKIVEKVEILKKEYEASLRELENMYGVLSQEAFKGKLNLSKVNLELYKEEIKTPVTGSLEHPKKTKNLPVFPKKEIHIKDMTLDEYYGIPEDIIVKYGSIESHHEDWEFMLKKIFHDSPIDLSKLEEIYNKITYDRGSYFVFEDWKAFIFNELSKSKSFLKQKYNSETNQLELLINEIKKS